MPGSSCSPIILYHYYRVGGPPMLNHACSPWGRRVLPGEVSAFLLASRGGVAQVVGRLVLLSLFRRAFTG